MTTPVDQIAHLTDSVPSIAASDKTATKGRSDRLPGLDFLRVFAATAVLAFHYFFRAAVTGSTSVPYPSLANFSAYGYAGVDLFFVISGFVIAWSSEGRTPLTFARARFLRLWPAFVVCMTVTTLVLLWAQNPLFPVDFKYWAANLIFVPHIFKQNFVDGAYWSIVAEITFYGWVFIAMCLGMWPSRIIAIGVVWLSISILDLFIHSGVLMHLFLTHYAGEFLGGVALYRIRVEGNRPALIVLLMASIVVALLWSIPDAADLSLLYRFEPDPMVLVSIHAVIFGLVAGIALLRFSPPTEKVALAVGGLTYPVYLLHQNIGYVLIDKLVANGIPASVTAFVVTAGVFISAWTVWRYVEPVGRRLLSPPIDYLIAVISKLAPRLNMKQS